MRPRRGLLGLATLVTGLFVTACVILAVTLDDDNNHSNNNNNDDDDGAKSTSAVAAAAILNMKLHSHAEANHDQRLRDTEAPLLTSPSHLSYVAPTATPRAVVVNYTMSAFNDTEQNASSVGWMVQFPQNFTIHKGFEANPHNYTYMLNADSLCGDFDPRRLKTLVFVETHVKYTDRRVAIRKTWAQRQLQKALNYRVVFLFANDGNATVQEAALREHYMYGDVCQEDFPERFENLSIKSVMGLKYAVAFCRNADYIVKVDDDIYLHMPNVIKSFERHRRGPFKDHLLCHRNRVKHILRPGKSLEVLRVKTMKYEVSHDVIPGHSFPPYCSGFSYSMSLRAARRLYEASLGTPLFFIEDVYVTGLCRHKAGVDLIDHPGITLRPPVTAHNAPCNFHFTDRITSNEVSPQEMLHIWDAINTAGFFCPK